MSQALSSDNQALLKMIIENPPLIDGRGLKKSLFFTPP
jgi:hypothetical protein